MINKKKKQSCLYKQKAIYEHIIEMFKFRASVDRVSFYADNNYKVQMKLPKRVHYGYDVKIYAYKINIKDKDLNKEGLSINGIIMPIYNKCKVVKARKEIYESNTN